MKLALIRLSSQKNSTLGALYDATQGLRFLCFTLEDEHREEKVANKTRVPSGSYNIVLRKEGGFHDKYKAKYPDFHEGMLWLKDVPGFEYVLVHTGNTDKDSSGCILIGNTLEQNVDKRGFLGQSVDAYKRVYPEIAKSILSGEKCRIEIIDFDEVS